MAKDELSGMIQVTAPVLPIGLPKSSTTKSASTKANKVDDPKALWGHTYKYKMLEASAQSNKVAATNSLYSIAKNKYGGDLSAFLNDPKVHKIINGIKTEQAMLSANRNSIETTYKNYEKARTNIEKNKAGDKYAIGNTGQRMFIDQFGKIRAEGQEGMKVDDKNKIEKQSNFLTNNQLLEYNRTNLGFSQTADGRFIAEQGEFGNPADFTKDAVGDYILKNLNAAKTQSEMIGSSPVGGNVPGAKGYSMITGIDAKTNINNLARMSEAALTNMPSEVQAQLKQRYWESGLDNSAGFKVKVPVRNNSGKIQKDKQGNTVYQEKYAFPTANEISDALAAQKKGSATEYQKQIIDDKNLLSEGQKFGLFVEDEVKGVASGLQQTSYNSKIIKGGFGSGSGEASSGRMTHTVAIENLLKSGETGVHANATTYSLVKPAKMVNGDIEESAIYEAQQGDQFSISYGSENAAPIEARNAEMKKNIIPEGDDEIDMNLVREYGIPVSNRGKTMIIGGVAYDSSELEGYIIEEKPVMHQFNAISYGPNGPSIGKTTLDENGRNSTPQSAYKEYRMVIPRDQLSKLEEMLVVSKQGETKRGDQTVAGTDLDNGGLLGGFIPSAAADALGIKDVSTEGLFSLDQIEVSVFIPVGAQDALSGGGTSQQKVGNQEVSDIMMSTFVSSKELEKSALANWKLQQQ